MLSWFILFIERVFGDPNPYASIGTLNLFFVTLFSYPKRSVEFCDSCFSSRKFGEFFFFFLVHTFLNSASLSKTSVHLHPKFELDAGKKKRNLILFLKCGQSFVAFAACERELKLSSLDFAKQFLFFSGAQRRYSNC